jgi:hypothetical protein
MMHICTIVFFSWIYFVFKSHFVNTLSHTEVRYMDCIGLSATIQAGVGLTSISPTTLLGKMIVLVQQLMMIGFVLLTFYLFS